MKAISSPTRPRRSGFTLVEILVVMVIIAALASLMLALGKGAREQSRRKKAQAHIAMMSEALESYKEAYGDYPEVASQSENPEDASRMLYQALSGDGSNMIDGVGGEASRGELGSSAEGRVFWDQLNRGNRSAGVVNEKKWMLVDPWGNPYHYVKGSPNKTQVNNRNTFDLWSTAGQKPGENEDKYITNWGQQ